MRHSKKSTVSQRRLYASWKAKLSRPSYDDHRVQLMHHYTDDIPDIDYSEIGTAHGQLTYSKSTGDDVITVDLPKAVGTPILKQLASCFNFIVHHDLRPRAWSRGAVVLFFKKFKKRSLQIFSPEKSEFQRPENNWLSKTL